MTSETKLDKIKQIASEWLISPLNKTDKSPAEVAHPFIRSAMVCYRKNGESYNANLFEDKNSLLYVQECFWDKISSAKKLTEIREIITPPYRLAFLQKCGKFMSEKDYAEFLANAFIICDHPDTALGMTKKKLLDLFKKADKHNLMRPEEYETFSNLPETIEVFRGVTHKNSNNIYAMSWTKNINVANWFASRHGEGGTIYRAFIDKKHIFAYFDLREEEEIVVNPAKLYNVSKIHTIKHKNNYAEITK